MKIYLKYKGASDAGHFETYNKETGENEIVDLTKLPLAVADVSYTVIGWDEASNSAIYSNDIKAFNDETFNVRSKGGTIKEGLYKDIKEDILAAGAKLHIKVVGIAEGNEYVISLKGLNFFQLSETLKNLNKDEDLLVFKGTEDDKKGAVKFKKTKFGVAKGKVNDNSFVVNGPDSSDEITMDQVPF